MMASQRYCHYHRRGRLLVALFSLDPWPLQPSCIQPTIYEDFIAFTEEVNLLKSLEEKWCCGSWNLQVMHFL